VQTNGLLSAMASQSCLSDPACRLLDILKRRKLSIVTAESCTAGALANLLSHAPGASEHLHGGFVTYTKAHKTKALGVSSELLGREGAVCGQVAIAMAEGALLRSPAPLAISITGVAGPEPDEDGNPVGLVCIAVARDGQPSFYVEMNYGDIGREAVTARAIEDALAEAIRVADGA
jgi:nicotinamide-nucleotide amidase